MLFQDTLKELRKNKGISQYDLAEALNISRSVVAKWETGLTLPNEENVKLLMEYFNVSKQELFKNEETECINIKNEEVNNFIICSSISFDNYFNYSFNFICS